MLVLSRHCDETVMIGDDIAVTIVDIRGDKVRLGVCAPSEVPVHRREVYEAIQRDNPGAAIVSLAKHGPTNCALDVSASNIVEEGEAA